MITSKQRAYLRSIGHRENAILQIGKGGINENLIKQIDDALKAREIIKLTVLETALMSTKSACEEICAATGAEPVQCIGGKIVIYRESRDNKKIVIPR